MARTPQGQEPVRGHHPRFSLIAALFAIAFSVGVWAGVLFALFGCTAAPTEAAMAEQSIQDAIGAPADAGALLRRPDDIGDARAAVLAGDGFARVVRPPRDCEWRLPQHQGPAVTVASHARCTAGREFVAVFQRRFAHGPAEAAWLLLSFAPPGDPVNLSSIGWKDCHLLVNPDPRFLLALTPQEGTAVAPERGRIVLRWTPEPWMAGWEMWLQQVWAQPLANPAAMLLSPMLHVRVGA